VEDGVEKFPVGRRGDGALVHGIFWIAGFLHQRQKLQIQAADLLQVAVHLGRVLDVDVVHHAEQIDVNFRPAQELESPNHLPVRGLLAFGDAVMIVQLARPVEAEPDVKIFPGEKVAPLLVDGRAVGLDAVDDFFVRGQMFFLKLDGLAEKVHAKQGRLAAVPGKAHDLARRRLDVLLDVLFERLVVEAEIGALRIEIFFLQVVAIVAVEVADRPDRLHHDLKFAGRGFQAIFLRAGILRPLAKTLLKKAADAIPRAAAPAASVELKNRRLSPNVGSKEAARFQAPVVPSRRGPLNHPGSTQAADCVIVGASFAGLACATVLARAGLRVTVLEKKSDPGEKLHTTGIIVKDAVDQIALLDGLPGDCVHRIDGVRLYAPNLRHVDLAAPGYYFLATDTPRRKRPPRAFSMEKRSPKRSAAAAASTSASWARPAFSSAPTVPAPRSRALWGSAGAVNFCSASSTS